MGARFPLPRMLVGHLLLLVAVAAVWSLLARQPLWHTDLWGHLAYGRFMIEHAGLTPATEPFLPYALDLPLVDTARWSQLIGYGVLWAGGVEALQLLYATLVTGCALLTVTPVLASRCPRRIPAAIAGAAIFLAVAWQQLEIMRPQLAGLALPWLVAGDGPARGDVARALGASRITYLGALDRAEIDALHAAADLAVWPALREAFGMALLEAQAAGLPVVAGASPGVARIVADGQTGLLTPAGDDRMLANAIRKLAIDPQRRRQMGHAAMQKAEQQHDIGAAAALIGRVLLDARAAT